MSNEITVEVVYALPGTQVLETVILSAGATVQDAIDASDLCRRFPDQDLNELPVGVWGHPASRDARVRNGDRVELYRPLQMDPRDARRRLARAGRTMAESRDGCDDID